MEFKETFGPSYKTLRPYKKTKTATFPVYQDLVDQLVAADEFPSDRVAHVMATCAGYAYSDVETVAMMMAPVGARGEPLLDGR